MKRGDLYRVAHASAADPKSSRVFVVVSRQALIATRFSTVICAPVYSSYDGLSTQVPVGIDEGLKHDSSLRRPHESTQVQAHELYWYVITCKNSGS